MMERSQIAHHILLHILVQVENKGLFSETGGVSIVYEHEASSLANTDNSRLPVVDMIGDNFNRSIGNSRWGKEVPLDVFHIAGVLRQIRAPVELSRTKPELPLNQLKGENDMTGHGSVYACVCVCGIMCFDE
jgi:hypothetical protein